MIKLLFYESTTAAVECGSFHLGSAIAFAPEPIVTLAILEAEIIIKKLL